MNYKLKLNDNNQVGYYMLSGNKFLHDLMSKEIAEAIINSGKTSMSDLITGFPICVDNKYYIEAESEECL